VPGKFSCVAEPGQSTLVMTQTFDAPRADVFEAWTTAEQVALWWDPTGAPLAVCEIDLRPNGTFRWINRGEIGAKHPFTGVYREITPPERLVFEARMSPTSPEQTATLVFAESRGMTTLVMTIECRSVAERDEMLLRRVDAGTARTLQNLATYLVGGRVD
jgi:uncharacterized protein YndB with AHSA1/START domain